MASAGAWDDAGGKWWSSQGSNDEDHRGWDRSEWQHDGDDAPQWASQEQDDGKEEAEEGTAKQHGASEVGTVQRAQEIMQQALKDRTWQNATPRTREAAASALQDLASWLPAATQSSSEPPAMPVWTAVAPVSAGVVNGTQRYKCPCSHLRDRDPEACDPNTTIPWPWPDNQFPEHSKGKVTWDGDGPTTWSWVHCAGWKSDGNCKCESFILVQFTHCPKRGGWSSTNKGPKKCPLQH